MKLDLFYMLTRYMYYFYEFPVHILFLFFLLLCISLSDFLGALYILRL